MIGKKIVELRKKRGMTLSELAEKANISKSYISGLERNINDNPSIQVINKIASILEVDVTTLIGAEVKHQECLETEWQEFVRELKATGIDKDKIVEYKTLIEFIKWQKERD
ncbi:MAG TPA: XRE family transcriptional regulator [Bacillus bacterium]|uniref:Transcriptional regulator n=1 Tax=Siminovitchia fordii TaxID=254759 RepID=A0ABQ4K5C5_9BACI|nr:helix-turn-helix transcriptional regulator [Siminovitchia fordii]GIN20933.1 transcriptional regulator [Siminovitchia fordii]HBZ12099.1 XRE family transcriptional regulator [Bacillus sp. (in: firmicutes)]